MEKNNTMEKNNKFTAAMTFNSDKVLIQDLRDKCKLGEKEMMRTILNVVLNHEAELIEAAAKFIADEKAGIEAAKQAKKVEREAEKLEVKHKREADRIAKKVQREQQKAQKAAEKAAAKAQKEAAKVAELIAKANAAEAPADEPAAELVEA